MPASIDTHLLTVVLVVALVAWRFYARIRRMVGRQRLSSVRPWFTIALLPLVLVLLLATGTLHPMTGTAAAGGLVAGIGLGRVGTRLTKFEATPAGLFYTPNAHLGIALSLLLVLRIGYRFVMLQVGDAGTSSLAMQPGGSPLTMAILGMLVGYYVTYAIGLLRWRARVGAQPPAEH
jgi:hypothetical protein